MSPSPAVRAPVPPAVEPVARCRARLVPVADPRRYADTRRSPLQFILHVPLALLFVLAWVAAWRSLDTTVALVTCLVPGVLWAVFFLPRPDRRGVVGEALLDAGGLTYLDRRGAVAARVALADLVLLGREGRRIHLVRREPPDWFLVCPRLQAEDVFDQLVVLLDASGHPCPTWEADAAP